MYIMYYYVASKSHDWISKFEQNERQIYISNAKLII